MNARAYRSTSAAPAERGYEFGRRFAGEIADNVRFYRELFRATGALGDDEIASLGADALEATGAWAPALREEIEAIAAGADLRPELVGALNGRTEVLGRCREAGHECTAVVALGAPGGRAAVAQTWDWHDGLDGGWLVWTIEHPSGRVVQTLTEYGIVGKLGVSSAGLALLLTILRHADDGGAVGTPVHVMARRILDEADGLEQARSLIASATPSASSAMTLVSDGAGGKAALSVEIWPGGPAAVVPNGDGVLVHTNHFLDPAGVPGDREPVLGPDSFARFELVSQSLSAESGLPELIEILASHEGGAGAICCHPDERAPIGERYATLATVTVDLSRRELAVHPGGPCTHPGSRDRRIPATKKEATWQRST